MTTNPQDLDALAARADIMAGMLRMGERIAYGSDADMICALSDAITTLRRDLMAERAQTLRDAAAKAYEVAHNTNDISKIRDAILAMTPEGE